MPAANCKHQLPAIAGVGPISLLLLPKCPLCIVPLLALLGLAIPPAMGMWVASGLLVAVWLAILFNATGTKPAVRGVAFAAAALSFVAIGFHVRLLLWIGVLTMTAAGFAPLTRPLRLAQGPPSPRWRGARDLTIETLRPAKRGEGARRADEGRGE